MTTLAMMNHKRHNPALVLGGIFVACFFIALLTSHSTNDDKEGKREGSGFSLAAAPLLSSSRISDTKSFHRLSFARPLTASGEPQFRSPSSVSSEEKDVRLASSPVRHQAAERDAR